jgi:hypothetical protein
MRSISFACVLAFTAATALLAGCSHKEDAKTELEKTADLLSKTETAQSPPPPAPEPAAPATVEANIPDQPAQSAPAATTTPSQQMRQALTAYKSGELEDAVTRLQKLRATATLTPQQRMAVQDSVAAVMTEIYELAAKGDSRALQAVKQYEQMQTSRH